jgi:UDP-glucose 4-epimerase
MSKSIYITGIAGLIGSSMAKHFLKKGWKVSGCDSLVGGYLDNVPNGAGFERVEVEKLHFLDVGHDVVFHAAALAHEGLSVFSPSLIANNIYGGTMKIASLAIENKAKLFINCSSMARYGDIIPPFFESDACNPVDPYGLAKLQAEQQLALLKDIYPNFNYYTVVPHNVCGAQQVYSDPYRNVLSIMVHQAIRGLPIYIYGDGEQKRSFSHVDDCVNAIDKLIEIQPSVNIFNIGPDHNEITINELAELVLKMTKSNSTIIRLDPRPREVKIAHCSSSRAIEILDYSATKSIEVIIQDVIDYILINGPRDFKYGLPIEIKSDKIPQTWTKQLFGKDAT